MLVYAVIPARSGSKGIPGKNVRLLGGHPLLAWSIVAASCAKRIDRVFVSTDSDAYADIAKKYGAEVPFLRPAELAQDSSTDVEFLTHAITWWREHEGKLPDLIVLLRPTTPLRDPALLDIAIEKMLAIPFASSLCSGFELPESPAKNFKLNEDGTFSGFIGDEYLNLPRQKCPKGYVWDGYIDILRTDRILQFPNDIYGAHRLATLTPPGVEIDTLEEFEHVEFIVSRKGHMLLSILDQRSGTV